MKTDNSDLLTTLAARIDRLETSNRRYRGAMVALLMCGAFALPLIPTVGQARKGKKTITAQRIALMSGGKVRLLMSAKGDRPKISLHGPAGTPRATLSLNPQGAPMLSLNGPDAKPRAVLKFDSERGSHLLLWGPAGRRVVKKLP